jgi:Zn-dependent peptidase ImmA (M78 family)
MKNPLHTSSWAAEFPIEPDQNSAAYFPQLLNQQQLCRYLGISTDTLRKMKKEISNFPTYFYRKYYSKFQIDKFLQKQPDKHNLHIETQVDEAIKEFFGEPAEPDVRLGAVERG